MPDLVLSTEAADRTYHLNCITGFSSRDSATRGRGLGGDASRIFYVKPWKTFGIMMAVATVMIVVQTEPLYSMNSLLQCAVLQQLNLSSRQFKFPPGRILFHNKIVNNLFVHSISTTQPASLAWSSQRGHLIHGFFRPICILTTKTFPTELG